MDDKKTYNFDKKKVTKRQTFCPRCKGDGIWHTVKTGYRLKTSTEIAVKPDEKCPRCGGSGMIRV